MNRRALSYCIVALLITAAIYFPVAGFQFVNWDDRELLLLNPLLNPPTAAHLAQIWTRPFSGLYTPLPYTAWWILANFISTLGESATTFHLLNLAMHLICVGLVFAILRKFIPSLPAVLVGTIFFALHPMQVETVAWVSEFNNLLSTAFSLAAILLFLTYASAPFSRISPSASFGTMGQGERSSHSMKRARVPTRDVLLYATSTTFSILALLSKPTAVVTPLIAGLLAFTLTRKNSRKILLALIPWLVAAIIFSLIARSAQSGPPTPPLRRPLIALDAIGFYAMKLAIPFGLTLDYARPPAQVLLNANWFPTTVTALVIFALLLIFRRERTFVAGITTALLALLPVLGFIPFAFQRYATVADHFLYLPMFGLSLTVAGIASYLDRRLQFVAVAALALLLGALTSKQLQFWHETQSLANHTLALDPLSTVGNKILAAEYSRLGQPQRALPYYYKALLRNPKDADVHYNLANALAHLDRFSEAIPEYRRALSLPSDNLNLNAMNNLGWAYAEVGRPDLAAEQFRKVLQIQPDNPEATANLRALGR
jgi:protein O-mannosyl-transferase